MAKKATRRLLVIRNLDDLREWLTPQIRDGWSITLSQNYRTIMRHDTLTQMQDFDVYVHQHEWAFSTHCSAPTAALLAEKFIRELAPQIDAEYSRRAAAAAPRRLTDQRPRLEDRRTIEPAPQRRLVFDGGGQ